MSKEDVISRLASEHETSIEDNLELEVTTPTSEFVVEFQRKKIERQTEEIESIKQDRKQRKIFSYVIFGFMFLYMAAAIVILWNCGRGYMELSDTILVTLLTTTLANVIGIFNFVARYLFHK